VIGELMALDYREIAGVLRDELDSGLYSRGSVFPTGPEIAARFKVSQGTANLAMNVLRTDGRIRMKRGRNTIVNPVPVITRDAVGRQRAGTREAGGARGAFDAELRQAGLEPRTTSEPGRAVPPAGVAAALGIPEETEAVYRRRLMYAGPDPVQLATSWLPADIASGTPIEETDPGPGGIYSRLRDLGHAPADFTEEVAVRGPCEDEADALELDPDHRVYDITRTVADGQGRVVEVNKIVLPTHQWRLVFRWRAEG
jgi:GntR family transcriptional regulator